jgi:bacterioferritin-associated ferredoxin
VRFRGRGRAGDEDRGSKAGSKLEVVFFAEGVGRAAVSRSGERSAMVQAIVVQKTKTLREEASRRVCPAGNCCGRCPLWPKKLSTEYRGSQLFLTVLNKCYRREVAAKVVEGKSW